MELESTEPPENVQVIESYRGGVFQVSGRPYVGAVLVTPGRTLVWRPPALHTLTPESFAPLVPTPDAPNAPAGVGAADLGVDLLLLGTGPSLVWPPSALRTTLRSLGIGLEVMDTGAACRTFNVLVAENRRVGAALWPVPD